MAARVFAASVEGFARMRAVFGDAFFHFPAATRATWFTADLFDVSDVAGAIFGSVFEAQFTALPRLAGRGL